MSFKHFEHQADVGIIGIGKTLEEAFQEGAKAMFQVMADLKQISPKKSIKITVKASDEAALFIEWLNELLAKKDIEDMMLSDFKVKIQKIKNKFNLTGTAKGEKTSEKHRLKVEVKAATYSQLKVQKEKNKYTAQCVVDV